MGMEMELRRRRRLCCICCQSLIYKMFIHDVHSKINHQQQQLAVSEERASTSTFMEIYVKH